jgi:hypothetical protein
VKEEVLTTTAEEETQEVDTVEETIEVVDINHLVEFHIA